MAALMRHDKCIVQMYIKSKGCTMYLVLNDNKTCISIGRGDCGRSSIVKVLRAQSVYISASYPVSSPQGQTLSMCMLTLVKCVHMSSMSAYHSESV